MSTAEDGFEKGVEFGAFGVVRRRIITDTVLSHQFMHGMSVSLSPMYTILVNGMRISSGAK